MGVGIGCLGMIIFAIILYEGVGSSDSSSGFIWFCLIGIGASAFAGFHLDDKRKLDFGDELTRKLKNIVKILKNFNVTQEFISPNLESYIAIDESNRKICIIENEHKGNGQLSRTLNKYDYKYYVYSFDEVIQSEILKDGVTINNTSRGSQIGGAIIGGVLAGGVGAIIGGMGASSESTSVVNKLELIVAVNNLKKSTHRVVFKSPFDFGKFITNREEDEIIHWHNLLTHIIKRVDSESNSTIINKETGSLTDDLKKLAELRNEGILTEEEFQQQKRKILEG